MEFVDIVDFDFQNPQEYGFSKMLRAGRDIRICSATDAKRIMQTMRNYDLVYFPSYDANVELITYVAKKNKTFLVPLADILKRKGAEKSVVLYRIRRFIRFCMSYKAKFVIASLAKSEYDLRSSSEVRSIAFLFGITEEQAMSAMRRL
ncbi:MAG: RNase P subunit p30 family protein [Candidatus Micrarchaeia archaeon]